MSSLALPSNDSISYCRTPSSSSLSSRRGSMAVLFAMIVAVCEARPLGLYWRSPQEESATAATTQNVSTPLPPIKRTHHLPGSAMSLLVDAWFDVLDHQQQVNQTSKISQAPTFSNLSPPPQSAPSHHQPDHQSPPTAASSSSASTTSSVAAPLSALMDWYECSSNFPTPRIEILSRHAHDNSITFGIEQQSLSSCHHHHYQNSRASYSSLAPPNPSSIRWFATQFQNARGNWICATQEAVSCRKRFIYTASCPATTQPDAISWARVALYMADDTLTLEDRDDHHDTCAAIRNSVATSRDTGDKQQQQRQQQQRRKSKMCEFHFQLPCLPTTPTARSSTSTSSSWTSTTASSTSTSSMSAI